MFTRLAYAAALGLMLGGFAQPSSAVAADAPVAALEVFPSAAQLTSARRQMQLAVTATGTDQLLRDVTRLAEYSSSNPGVATVSDGIISPVSNGKAEVVVRYGGHEQRVAVTVSGFSSPEPVSFRYETLVALTKHGCNMGACHGSPSGKGGFRLSLRAYDPVLDEETLTREVFNRRTNLLEPSASLLLRKPLMEVPHGGGQRLRIQDPSYQLLHDWIAQGLKTDPPQAAHCVKLQIYPTERVLKRPEREQQIVALAHFSDGSVRDVTDLVSYSSSDDEVATVDAGGLVTSHQRGEAAVLVRYLEFMQTAELTFLEDVPGFAWPNPQPHNPIDELVFAKLRRLQIPPSELCTDEEFVRRVYLDLLGILPTPEETTQFLNDTNPAKRARLIDALFQRPEYAAFWAQRWADLLRVNEKRLTATGVHKFQRWLLAAVRDNLPYDEFTRELVTASGSTFENPPANYYRAAADMNDCTETTAQLFLGIRIQCAKCHNHPFEQWTQDNYYGIAAFFNRVQRKQTRRGEELFVWVARSGEVQQPRTGQTMQPWLPLTGNAEVPPEADRREVLADWLAQPDNPFFAQAEVNRMWGHLFGRGIVEPVDDFRASNPPSNRELLDWLAAELVRSNFDRQHVMKLILNSRVYQQSSQTNELNRDDEQYFSHYPTRLLAAEPLLEAICQVTGVPEKFPGLPAGTRATALPGPQPNHQFLKVFGQPAREMACECERTDDSSLSQALQMINGPLMHAKLRHEGNRLRAAVKAGQTDEQIVRQLYLAALSRQPSAEELAAALAHVSRQGDRLRGLEDVTWAVLNAKEFLFQH